MKFQTAYGYIENPPEVGEIGSGELLVESSGYMTIEQQVSEFMAAGENLINYRKQQYGEIDPGTEDDFELSVEATRPDPAEVTQMALSLSQRFEEFEREARKAEKEKSKKEDDGKDEGVEK